MKPFYPREGLSYIFMQAQIVTQSLLLFRIHCLPELEYFENNIGRSQTLVLSCPNERSELMTREDGGISLEQD